MTDQAPMQPDAEYVISDLEALKVYFDPLRVRIMQELVQRPRSVNEVAEALGIPFTRLYYHFHLLEKHNLIRLVETRSVAGAVEEKYYQVRAYSFPVERTLLTVGNIDAEKDKLEIILEAVFDEARRHIRQGALNSVIDMTDKPPKPRTLMCRRGIARLSQARAAEFYQRMVELLLDFTASSGDSADDSEYFEVVAALYPLALPDDEAERV